MSQKIYTNLDIKGNTKIGDIANATSDTDKFLVSDAGVVKYRTGSEMLSDLGVAPGVASNVQHQVKAGVAINKGQAVYVTGADGTNTIVGLASNASEATSSKTMGLLNATVATNGFADVITEGLLDGLNTIGANSGDPVWLGTGGNLIYGLTNKPYAPNHLVFIGIVTRVNANNGEIFVKVQNGFELDEIHDVDLKTTTKVNGHLLGYNGSLWVNKTISEWLGYTPYNASNPAGYITSSGSITGNAATATNADYANAAGTASTATNANYLSILGGSGGNLNTMPYGRYYNYGSGSYWINGPSGMSYGSVYNFGGSSESVLSLQLAADINHNSTSSTRTMWFRTGNNLGFQNDWKEVLHSGNYSSFAVPTSRTITINGTSYDLSANRSWTVSGTVTSGVSITSAGSASNTPSTPSVNIGMYVDTYAFIDLATADTNGSWIDFSKANGTDYGGRIRYNNGSDYFSISAGATEQVRIFNSNAEAIGSFRAPIFYDSNNTSYYIDPASTSNINALNIGNAKLRWGGNTTPTLGLPFTGSTNAFWIDVNDGDTGGLVIDNEGVTVYGAGDTGYVFRVIDEDVYQGNSNVTASTTFQVSQGANGGGYMRGIFNVTDYLIADNSARAPIFYDSNDTTYYGDFASTSYLRHLSVGDVNAANDANWNARLNLTGSSHARLDVKSNSDGIITTMYSHTGQGVGRVGTMSNHPLAFMVNAGIAGYAYANYIQGVDSVRAPLFYDSNNTAYYVDPASGSNLYDLALSGGKHTYLYINPGNGYEAMVRYNGGSGNTWYAGKRTTTGINSTADFHFYSDAAGADVFGITTGGIAVASGDMRAPIFYDNNNTGYYCDPSSVSYLNVIQAANRIFAGWDSGQAGSISCSNWFRTSGSTGWYNESYAGGWYMVDSSWVRSYNDKGVYTGGIMQSADSHRAPIFYDLNNTGYYLDPNSVSNLYGITTANPSASTSNTDTHGCSPIKTSSHIVTQSDSNFYPMITGYTTVANQGYINMPSFGYMRPNGPINGDAVIKNSGDGLGAIYWKFKANGDFVSPGDVVAYSDKRVKSNIENITNALDKVKAIRGVTFTRTDSQEGDEEIRHMGVIAQELLSVVPEVVKGTDNTNYSVAYGNLAGLFIEAIKEQQKQIEELKELVNQLIKK